MKVIDTDIAINHFHGHHAALEYFALHLGAGETLLIAAITLTELLGGMRAGEETRTERLLELFVTAEVTDPIARKAGEYLRQYRRSHHLELGDALVAATAFQLNAELVTRNRKHYPMPDINLNVPYARGK